MKFSIIVPCYNLERYIGAALDSILAQTFKDYECIVVDDGSTDDSPRIVDEYAVRDPRIKVIHKSNGGEGSARNAGLDVAQGEWIVYLDGDDVLSPGVLVVVSRAILENTDLDIVAYGSKPFKNGNKAEFEEFARGIAIVDCRTEIPDSLGMIGVWQMVYLRERFGDLRFKGYKLGADLVYTSKCFSIADKIGVVQFVGHGYRQRAGSAVRSPLTKQKMLDRIDYRREMFESFYYGGKKIGPVFCRNRGNLWLWNCAIEISRIGEEDQREVFDHWIDSLESARRMPFFSLRQKLLIWLLMTTRSWLIVKLLVKARSFM